MRNKHNPDDRSDNVEKIQENINDTIRNMELAEDMMERTSDSKTRKDLKEKNERRRDALEGFRHEIKDEADARKKEYKD
jgi:small acid-soluble spore protein (thioredoxin-like protein)